jgi:maleylpyruvate isomerase
VRASQQRFEAALDGLTDTQAAEPSLLPGWTVGHLLSHVARNADSHVRRAEAAARNEFVEQYPGGLEGRAAEIEGGAGRSATELLADVHQSASDLDWAWERTPDTAWGVESRDASGTVRTLASLPSRRWQELEVHLIDLGRGPTHRDWPDDFVAAFLPAERVAVAARLPAGVALPPAGTLDERDELAWIYGRLQRGDLPQLPDWR